MGKILCIGGPGNISTSAMQALLARGSEVAIFILPASPDRGMKRKVKFSIEETGTTRGSSALRCRSCAPS